MPAVVSRIRSAPGNCPKCNKHYRDLLEHVRKAHKDHKFKQADFAHTHLEVCLCGSVAASLQGLRSHHSRTDCDGARAAARAESGAAAVTNTGAGADLNDFQDEEPEGHQHSDSDDGERPPQAEREESVESIESLDPLLWSAAEIRAYNERHGKPISQEFPEELEDGSAWARPPPLESDESMETEESIESVESVELLETPDRRPVPAAPTRVVPPPTRPTLPQTTREMLPPPPRLALPPRMREAPARRPALPPARRPGGPAAARPTLPSSSSMTLFFGFVDMEQAFLRMASLPVTYKKLPPHVTTAFGDASEKAAERFLANPSDKSILEFLCLPKVGLAPGQPGDASHRLSVFPDIKFPEAPPRREPSGSGPSPQKQVELGRLGNAARILGGQGSVATPTPEVVDALRSKHPQGPQNPFGAGVGPFSHSPPSTEALVEALESFKPDTAPGVSGWTVSLLKVAMRSDTVKRMLTTLAGMILAGTAPGRAFLCSSRLIALDKPDGGVRPIAVGDLVYRLCTKAIVRHTFKPDFLSPGQYGVGTKGGVEPLIRAVQRAVDGTIQGAEFTHVTSLDFSNAFNTLDRADLAKAVKRFAPGIFKLAKWAYNEPSQLVLGGGNGERFVLSSAQGVRQGDPLGPLLFSIGVRTILDDLSTYLGPDCALFAYLDDVYVLSKTPDALQDVKEFFNGSGLSLKLNAPKSFTTPVANIKANGMTMLGSCIGPRSVREEFLLEKVIKQEERLSKLVDLPHQHALLVLTKCMQQDLRHLQRCLVSDDLVHIWKRLDKAIWDAALRIRGASEAEGLETTDIDHAILCLPARNGGLGLLSHEQCAPLAYAAAADTSDHLLAPLLGPPASPPKLTDSDNPESISPQRTRCAEMLKVKREDLLATLDAQQSKTIIESASGLGRRWLSVIPYYQGLRLTDFEVSAGLHLRTLHPGSHTICSLCGNENSAGHAEVCVGRKRWITARHEQVKRAIATALSKVQGVRVAVEPNIGATNRRNDMRVTGSGASGLANHEYDVTIVSLATRDSIATRLLPSQEPTNLAEKSHALITKFLNSVAANKIRRLPANNVPFSPLVFTVGGLMEATTTKCLKLWQDSMPISAFKSLCSQLSLVLLRARAKSFVL